MANIIKNLKNINLIKLLNLQGIARQTVYLLAIAIFVVVNFLLSPISLRLDLSYGKAYTLSSSSQKILKGLDDVINIKFFVSSDLPTRLLPLKNDVTDLLDEYKKDSRGKVNIKILDPKKDKNALNEAKEIGLPEVQFSQLEKDKYAVTTSYFGMVLSYADKKEILPQVTDFDSLEYNLTALIYKLTKKELPQIAVLGQEDIYDPREDPLLSFKKIMLQQFDLKFLDISSNSSTHEINPAYKTIIVFDTDQKEYEEQEVAAIRNYLNQGGKAIFFVDGLWVKDDLTTQEAKHNLFSLMDDFGVKINNDLILSSSSELVNFGNETVSFFAPYPFWLRTTKFNSQVAYFSNVSQLTYPWVSSLTLTKKGGVKPIGLVNTSNQSWQQKENFNLNPQEIPVPNKGDLKEYLLTAQAKNNGEIVVIPSSRFVLERYLSRSSANLEFVLNIANDLASGGALSGIRQRAVLFYPLPDIAESQKDIFKYLNILLLPSLLAIFGGVRLFKRR